MAPKKVYRICNTYNAVGIINVINCFVRLMFIKVNNKSSNLYQQYLNYGPK